MKTDLQIRGQKQSPKSANSMKVLLLMLLTLLAISCSYDEDMEVCAVSVKLAYPENSVLPYSGARVEMKDATASIFVAETDASGIASRTY